MNDFIIERNIERYAERLRTELDPVVRASVTALLIEEEDRFGARVERLDKINGYIADCYQRIDKQKSLITGMRSDDYNGIPALSDGRDLSLAQRLLSNLKELLALFERRRHQIADELASYPRHPDAMQHSGTSTDGRRLTQREVEVLSLVAQGNAPQQIADMLRVTRRTVEAHVQAILPKLEATNGDQAVAIALNAGIIKFN
jgi:DNA-binding CsgD family transcriptional regulator